MKLFSVCFFYYLLKDFMDIIDNSVQLGQPVDVDIFESEESEKNLIILMRTIREILSRTDAKKRVSKKGQSRSKVHDRTLNGVLSTPSDRPNTIFNNEVSYLTDSADSGRPREFEELRDIAPKKYEMLSRSEARRFLGRVSNEIFQHYLENGCFLLHKDGNKNVYYRYELIEFQKSGKRLSAHDEEVLNKKLQAEKNGTNLKPLF